ncbi:acyltransferase family protein [Pseudonocardia eucalypti]|uniref:Acyltransferase family protein n=1 Tax=Pseudonocardia eucalypti TaxID=648755 RepID=A0ABP9PK88_9PSEU|nr:peptidoglycan/LPS O-acetylase OafA/YrhL [Pseudonocardia eucalypti]
MTKPTVHYRPELHGLRALAAALVVVYHVWLGRVSGGVDVFFLLTGFLLTGQVVRALEDGRFALGALYGRTLRRLLPAATVVLLACVVFGALILPPEQWSQTIREVFAAALFVENWQLVHDSADYFSEHVGASPVQHFWSLSVQGQFTLVWPALAAIVVAAGRRRGWAPRPVVGAALLAVTGGSLAYSVWLTSANQQLAYFDSLTRVWEFTLGGLLALVIDRLTVPRPARIALGWLGVLGLVACGLVLRVGTDFPGYAALWPTLAAAAVLIGGTPGGGAVSPSAAEPGARPRTAPPGADRLLTSRSARYLADISYPLYLWHWPVLVFFLVAAKRTEPGVIDGLLVVGLSVLLAAATRELLDCPAAQPRTLARLAAATLVPTLLAAGAWQLIGWQRANSYALAVDDPNHPGALAMEPGFEYWGEPDVPPAPSPIALPGDWAGLAGLRCETRDGELEVCTSPTAGEPALRLAVVGDSHPTQFLAALRPIAARRDWQLIVLSRPGCPFSSDAEIDPADQACRDWTTAAADELLAQRPDAVLTMATRDVRAGLTERTPPGFVAEWRRLDGEDRPIPVLAVRDNPRFDFSPPRCVREHGPDAPHCAGRRAELLAPVPPYAELPDVPANVSFLDFTDYYCDPEQCPPVIGNVSVYMDDNHVSATYLTSMAPAVEREIDRALNDYHARNSPS